ncbi:MAG: glycosyl hydrolase family 28 protein [Planctomycetes bacterium]|nr:glycosyl hydrolase family 28 protein [Planctomycetota bacterium]
MRHFGRTSILLAASILLMALPGWARIWDVNQLGAQGDKRSNDAPVIQKAIDNAAQAGGGTVYVPAGNYRCGQLQLRSHVTLYLESGATLWVSPDKADYQRGNTFLLAQDQNNITIGGRGTIHGTGQEDLQRKRGDKRPRPDWRAGILRFTGCTNVAIRDITIRYSDTWTLDLERCEDVVIDGVRILNNYYRVNADGIDPVSCRRVRISNCSIVAGDDCIVCKTREGRPCEDIVVTNCVLESIATAVKIGTESPSDFRNILVSNCVIRNSTIGLGLFIKDGGTAERISFSNCTIETIRQPELANESLKDSIYPIFVDIEKRQANSRIGKIRALSFSDISILSDNGILIQGMTSGRIENVSLRNVTMRIDGAADYARRKKHVGGKTEKTEDRRETVFARQPSYVTLANLDGLTVNGLRVLIPDEVFTKFNRSALSLHSVTKATLTDLRRDPPGADSNTPVVMMENCRSTLLTGCLALPNTGVFLGLAGKETADIFLKANDLTSAREAMHVSEGVPRGSIRD